MFFFSFFLPNFCLYRLRSTLCSDWTGGELEMDLDLYLYGLGSAREMEMFCLDPKGQKIKVTVQNQDGVRPYYDHILVLIKDPLKLKYVLASLQEFQRALLQQVLGPEELERTPENCLKVEAVQMRPAIGFRDLRWDTLLKIQFSNLFFKYRLKALFSRDYHDPILPNCTVGDYQLGKVELVHPKVSSEHIFLQQSGLRLGTWIHVRGRDRVQSVQQLKKDGAFRCVTCSLQAVQTLDLERDPRAKARVPAVAPFVVAYLEVSAVTGASSSTMQYIPTATEPSDRIVGWTVHLLRESAGGDGGTLLTSSSDRNQTEAQMLLELQRALEPATVLCYYQEHFNPVEFIFHRLALAHRQQPGSVLPRGLCAMDLGCKKSLEKQDIVFKKALSMAITRGFVRMDLQAIIKKRMVKPNLESFNPPDIVRHPKIIKRGSDGQVLPALRPILEPPPSSSSALPNLGALAARRHAKVMFLKHLTKDISALENHSAISRECSLSFSEVCEGGSEKRITSLLLREFVTQKYYINEEERLQMVRHPVFVHAPRSESTFPDPVWHLNPSRSAFKAGSLETLKRAKAAVLGKDSAGAFGKALGLEGALGKALGGEGSANTAVSAPPGPSPKATAASAGANVHTGIKRKSKALSGIGPAKKVLRALSQKRIRQSGAIDEAEFGRRISDLENKGKSKKTEKEYSGGLVLDPEEGFYSDILEWIFTFDFASLYPSIMEWAGICWTKVVCREEDLLRDGKDLRISKIPIDERRAVPFVTHTRQRKRKPRQRRQGETGEEGKEGEEKEMEGEGRREMEGKREMEGEGKDGEEEMEGEEEEEEEEWGPWVRVPSVMDDVIHLMVQNRKRCRAKQKLVPAGSFEWFMLEAEQLTWKVLQNACYGFMGSSTSPFVYKNLGAVVCSLGQYLIKKCRWWVMERGSRLVYGDTDSIMVQIPLDDGFIDFARRKAQEIGQVERGQEDKKKGEEEVVEKTLSVDDDELLQWAGEYNFLRALEWEKELTALFDLGAGERNVIVMELECIKIRSLYKRGKKKTYVGLEVPAQMGAWLNPSDKGLIIKGFCCTKRDKCPWVHKWSQKICRAMVLDQKPSKDLLAIFRSAVSELETIVRQRDLAPLTITCNIAETYKSDACIGPWLKTMSEEHFGRHCMPGDRLRFVHAETAGFMDAGASRQKAAAAAGQEQANLGASGRRQPSAGWRGDSEEKKQFQKAVLTEIFDKRNDLQFDTTYYLEKQLLLAVEQLMDHDHEFMYNAKSIVRTAVKKFENLRQGQKIAVNAVKSVRAVRAVSAVNAANAVKAACTGTAETFQFSQRR